MLIISTVTTVHAGAANHNTDFAHILFSKFATIFKQFEQVNHSMLAAVILALRIKV